MSDIEREVEALIAQPSLALKAKRAPRAKVPATPCTVAKYLIVLSHELTRYDMAECARESKRGRPNIYRLGLLLEAAHLVGEDVAGHMGGSPEDIAKFRQALGRRFDLRDKGFPPIKKLLKQVDAGTCKIK